MTFKFVSSTVTIIAVSPLSRPSFTFFDIVLPKSRHLLLQSFQFEMLQKKKPPLFYKKASECCPKVVYNMPKKFEAKGAGVRKLFEKQAYIYYPCIPQIFFMQSYFSRIRNLRSKNLFSQTLLISYDHASVDLYNSPWALPPPSSSPPPPSLSVPPPHSSRSVSSLSSLLSSSLLPRLPVPAREIRICAVTLPSP